jgi:hypothetical protein
VSGDQSLSVMAGSMTQPAELPPLLMTSEPGSFARRTIEERKPQILRQVVEDNDYPPRVVERLATFGQEIAAEPLRPLGEEAPDADEWNRELAAYRGRTWVEMPWYLAEAFFYRRLLEAVGYFRAGPWQRCDPFAKPKQAQMALAVERLAADWDDLAVADTDLAFEALLHSSLWGNRADLSNESIRLAVRGGLAAREERHNLLVDHTEQVQRILADGLERVDFVNDNVGLDLLFDLALADLLLDKGWVGRVVFHLKAWPFFVSDAMPQDAEATLALLEASPGPAVRDLGARLRAHLAADRLRLQAEAFWTSPLMFHQFPPSLRADLARSGLVILKGDVNYRRLLDDRHWPHTARLEEVTAGFPAPLLVLRILKGEILVGLAPGQAESLAAQDPTWLINGQRGLIHYSDTLTL